MLEIYNEQVRDLLNPKTIGVKGGLKVRQDPKKGFYGEKTSLQIVTNLIYIYLRYIYYAKYNSRC